MCVITYIVYIVFFTLVWAFIYIYKNLILTSVAGRLWGGHHVFKSRPNWFLWQWKATTGSLSCLEGEGEVRGIQLQHATSPLDVTNVYTLNL